MIYFFNYNIICKYLYSNTKMFKKLSKFKALYKSSQLTNNLLFKSIFSKNYLLKNGKVVNSHLSENKDVLISNGKINSIDNNINPNSSDTEVIDCTDKLIIPGGIDTHCHMQLPFMGASSMDDFNTGSKAAIAGGTTSFIDFIIPNKSETLTTAYNRWRSWADNKVNCDYALHCAITEWTDTTKDQMRKMVEKGVTSFKFFMAYNGALRLDDQGLLKAFETARDLGALCLVHAQNGDLIEYNQQKLLKDGITGPQGHYLSRPSVIQAQAVHRVITIAEQVNCPIYIVHIMSKQSAEEIQRAKNRGSLVFAETLAASLGTDGRKLWDKNWDIASRYVMSPPLNPDPTVKTHLMKMMQSKVIDVVGTDNCTFCTEQKRMGKENFTKIPNGVNGLEDRMSVVWTKGVRTGLLSQNEFVNVVSTQAAKIFNLYPQKGIIRNGSDADVVVWNPNYRQIISKDTHHHNLDYNIFEGLEVYGKADYTFSRGKKVWDGKQFFDQGKGEYLARGSFGTAFERHKYWTINNDPLNQKVDRSNSNNPVPTESEIQSQLQKLRAQLQRVTKQRDQLKKLSETQSLKTENPNTASLYDKDGTFVGVDAALDIYLPQPAKQSVRKILYGTKCNTISLDKNTQNWSENNDVEIKSFSIPTFEEQTRKSRIIKIGAIQNKIVKPTTQPIKIQKQAILDRIGSIIDAAGKNKANVICLQQIWNAPFFMCTRQRYPWVEFSEPINGESTQFLSHYARKYNMVIISSILERDQLRGTLHNTAVVIDNDGDVLGTQVKGHIPRVGDFNESSYYMQGSSGHPVFDTEFGKFSINICYGRHHPLHWMGFGLNGAEVVFNPSATVGGLSQHLWGIEARNAAIANHYFSVGINRIGTEIYPNAFTSGDGRPAHNDFGHFYGSTYVTAPDGSRTPSLCRNRDGLLLTEVDLNMCQQVKDKWLFKMTGRFELYAELLQKYTQKNYEAQLIRKKSKKN